MQDFACRLLTLLILCRVGASSTGDAGDVFTTIIPLPQLPNPAGLTCCLCMQSASIPSGLNNLGNTCYVNAALQGLFMIRGFREGLFAVEEPIADSPIVSHIRRAAGAMKSCNLLCRPVTLAAVHKHSGPALRLDIGSVICRPVSS